MKRIAKKKTIAKEENVVKKNKENVRYRTNPISLREAKRPIRFK